MASFRNSLDPIPLDPPQCGQANILTDGVLEYTHICCKAHDTTNKALYRTIFVVTCLDTSWQQWMASHLSIHSDHKALSVIH